MCLLALAGIILVIGAAYFILPGGFPTDYKPAFLLLLEEVLIRNRWDRVIAGCSLLGGMCSFYLALGLQGIEMYFDGRGKCLENALFAGVFFALLYGLSQIICSVFVFLLLDADFAHHVTFDLYMGPAVVGAVAMGIATALGMVILAIVERNYDSKIRSRIKK